MRCCHSSDCRVIGTNSKQAVSWCHQGNVEERAKRNTSGIEILKRRCCVMAHGTILILGCVCGVFIGCSL